MPVRPASKGMKRDRGAERIDHPMPSRYSAMAMVKGMKAGAAANANIERLPASAMKRPITPTVRWPHC